MALLCLFLKEHPDIRKLNLSCSHIGDQCIKELAKNKTLISLDVHDNYIGDKGTQALAENKTLISLDLSHNNIGDKGAMALAENKTISYLTISYNNISDKGAKALAKNKNLTFLKLKDKNKFYMFPNAHNNQIFEKRLNLFHPTWKFGVFAKDDNFISKKMRNAINERIQLNIRNVAQYKNECKIIASLLHETSSFFNTSRLPKDITHVILQKLANAYELPYKEQEINAMMSNSLQSK